MSIQFFQKLSQNYIEALKDDEYYDIKIEVGEDPEVKIFRAHMIILSLRSPYLRRELASNKKVSDGVLTQIKLSNILPEIFQVILDYIYGGILSLNKLETSNILEVLAAADKLRLQELVDYLQTYLIKNESDWMEQHFDIFYRTSFQSNNLLQLQNYCTDFMTKFPEKIFKSLDFTSISEKSLISLIKIDDLQMKEIEIWEHLLRWGLAQNPTLISDPITWTDDDFKSVENTLKNCLPFIRFYGLSSKDFLQKVHPYKNLLKPRLYEDLLKYYLDPESEPSDNNVSPPRYGKCDSKIVNLSIFSLVSKWIDKIDVSSKFAHKSELYLPYEFKLLLSGSRDGFSSKVFHSLCDGKPKTITFIKVKGTDEILGGYNPIIWETINGPWVTCKDSFIFSFKIKNNIFKDAILSHVKTTDHALYYSENYGPSFGLDLVLNANRCEQKYYEKRIREETGSDFLIEDYEVFQIVNKNLETASSNGTDQVISPAVLTETINRTAQENQEIIIIPSKKKKRRRKKKGKNLSNETDQKVTSSNSTENRSWAELANHKHEDWGKELIRDWKPPISISAGDWVEPPISAGDGDEPPTTSWDEPLPTSAGDRVEPPTTSWDEPLPTSAGDWDESPTTSWDEPLPTSAGDGDEPPTTSWGEPLPTSAGDWAEPLTTSWVETPTSAGDWVGPPTLSMGDWDEFIGRSGRGTGFSRELRRGGRGLGRGSRGFDRGSRRLGRGSSYTSIRNAQVFNFSGTDAEHDYVIG